MNLVNKMIRAAKLDVQLYEEVEKDIGVTKEAFLVVLIGAICNGIGSVGMVGGKGNNNRSYIGNYWVASMECRHLPYRGKNF